MSGARARVLIAVALLALAGALAYAARPQAETAEARVDRIAEELRCTVCQGLSVKDSPSETARQMRDLVAERVAEGRTDAEIREEFRAAYGDWVFLSPPLLDPRGLAWLVPVLAVVAGALVAYARIRGRGAPGPRSAPPDREPTPSQLAALRERVAREEALE